MDGVFTIRVTFDAMGVDIVSYFFELKFDQDIVVVQAVNGVASSPFDNPVTDSTTFSSGTVPFAANNSTVTPANGVFDVAELSLKAIGPAGSTSSLLLDVPFTGVIVSARDTNDDGQFDMFPLIPEPKITLEGGSVTIQ